MFQPLTFRNDLPVSFAIYQRGPETFRRDTEENGEKVIFAVSRGQWLPFLEHGYVPNYHFRPNESGEGHWHPQRGDSTGKIV